MRNRFLLAAVLAGSLFSSSLRASDPPPPGLIGVATSSNAQRIVLWEPYPTADQYTIFGKTNVGGVFSNDLSGVISGFTWTGSSSNTPAKFFKLGVTPMSSNALLSASVLNRLAYGPTPDELARVTSIGPQAYIDEQLNMGGITDTIDSYVSITTNAVTYIPQTNWLYTSVTGYFSSSNLYVYLDGVGDAYIDDIQVHTLDMTGQPFGPNYVINGDFESPFPGTGWQVATNLTGSSASSAFACSGAFSLHLVSTSPGSTRGSAVSQFFPLDVALVTNKAPCQLSYRYLQNSNSHQIIVRLSGSGVLDQGGDDPLLTPPQWIYVTQTGPASSGKFYIYLGGADDAYIDDIKFVAGSTPEAGANLLQNGDFESAFPGPWNVSTNLTNSSVSATISHSGAGSLHIISSAAGSTQTSAIWQDNLPVVTNSTYTLSYWYVPAGRTAPLTVRLSASGITTTPDQTFTAVKRRLDTAQATLAELRNWHCTRAVSAKAQLLEILDQFIENHFVTQWSKTRDFFDNIYNNNTVDDPFATDMEYRENSKWRAALLNPQCTFSNLLAISAESPTMIIYLDTVGSKGNGANIANENYAREVLELFTCGVDNGYDQNDIVQLSRAWTGWSVDIVDPPNKNNPFAPVSVTYNPGVSSGARSNLLGVWTFHYNQGDHSATNKYLFFNQTTNGNQIVLSPKHVPARFGSPWAGLDYSLVLTNNSGTNGIRDGYRAIAHLANLPFTEEYISVKLCRIFVHDNFPNPTTRTDLSDYSFYDYTDPNRSAEAELVHQCMLAWENSSPKGNIRAVLTTIFNSDLFRSHGGSLQKVKTPLEYTASAVRALRALKTDGTYTANVDGNSFSTPLSRMGTMLLFDRAAPDGYPEAASPWVSSGTLAERIRFIQSFCIAVGQNGHTGSLNDAGNNSCDPVALLKLKLPSSSWNNAGAVADYFLGILYPAEGKANLDQYRSLAIAFLDTDDTGLYNPPTTSFSTQVNTGTTYDTRVRGMVGMLMTLPRFHEQ